MVKDTQVTFNGTVANATAIARNFGDVGTISEDDPVYAYGSAGTFNVVMTASGLNGSFSKTEEVTILLSFDLLLTGGPARPEGKSWRLKTAFTSGKKGAGPVANGLGIMLPSLNNLLGVVDLGALYEDTLTFVYDGTYKVDNKDG